MDLLVTTLTPFAGFHPRLGRPSAIALNSCFFPEAAVVVSLIRRTGELPTEPLTDDDLCGIADDLFASLDNEENGNNNAEAR